jgi:hypothetical protein
MDEFRRDIARSLALHRAVAEQRASKPEWREASLARLDRWQAQGCLQNEYAARWRAWLKLADPDLWREVLGSSDAAADMRQTSPLTCNLHAKQRWALLKGFRPDPHESLTAPNCLSGFKLFQR